MSDSSGALRRQLGFAADLHGMVRTMKTMAASSIGRYEQAVHALADYDQVVKEGLGVVLRQTDWRPGALRAGPVKPAVLNAIVFGSDQGLVGQFNDVVAAFAIQTLDKLPGAAMVSAVGERVNERLAVSGLAMKGLFPVPNDVGAIAALVGHLQVQTDSPGIMEDGAALFVFHNRQNSAAGFAPMVQRLLPLDREWVDAMIGSPWRGRTRPELLAAPDRALRALVRDYLFIALFRACAESLASENASRLAAMQRAEKNIEDRTQELTQRYHRVRQTSIDEQLFDVVSGFEALA